MIDWGSVPAGIAANIFTKIGEALWKWGKSEKDEPGNDNSLCGKAPDEEGLRLFQTFDARFDMENIAEQMVDPVIHLVVDDQDDGAWHDVCVVVESRATREWYVSSKGNVALEGTGGGLLAARLVIDFCNAKKLPIATWVGPKDETDLLASGQLSWSGFREKLVPLLSYAKDEYFAKYIVKEFKRLQGRET
jgi:hypothetical protein